MRPSPAGGPPANAQALPSVLPGDAVVGSASVAAGNSPRKVLFASLTGTAIEFFDFYIYANATVLVFPRLFFPQSDAAAAQLAAFLTFALAFIARPLGAAVFGHFGDRVGRKTTLVAALLTMGISTVVIGLLPTYASAGLLAPVLLSLCRLGQGFGLGGEWGGAVLLAVENAPPGRRAWYGMFPQLGAPIGFLLAGSVFMLLSTALTDEQFLGWGWRIPFLASSTLVALGLYVRFTLTETPVFAEAMKRQTRVKVPILELFRRHSLAIASGVLIALSTYVLFYLLSVFTLSWATTALGYRRASFLTIQLFGVLFFAATVPVSGLLADRGRRRMLTWVNVAIVIYGSVFATLFASGTAGALVMMSVGMALVGLSYGPMGTTLSELFPTPVRYSGTSVTFNAAGILGASPAPFIATQLATMSLSYVGGYLSLAGLLSLFGLMFTRETRDTAL